MAFNSILYLAFTVHVNQCFSDFQHFMDVRFEDLKAEWKAQLQRVEEVLDARLKHLEER